MAVDGGVSFSLVSTLASVFPTIGGGPNYWQKLAPASTLSDEQLRQRIDYSLGPLLALGAPSRARGVAAEAQRELDRRQPVPQPVPEPVPTYGGIALPPISFPAPRRRPRPKPPPKRRRRRPPPPPRPPPRRPRPAPPDKPGGFPRVFRRSLPFEILRVLGTIPKRFGGRPPGGGPAPPEQPPGSGVPPDWRKIFDQQEEEREERPVPEVVVTARVRRPKVTPEPSQEPAQVGRPGALPSPKWCTPEGDCIYDDERGRQIRDEQLYDFDDIEPDDPDFSEDERWSIWQQRRQQDAEAEPDVEDDPETDLPLPGPLPYPQPQPSPWPLPPLPPPPRPIYIDLPTLKDFADLWLRAQTRKDARRAGRRRAPVPGQAPELTAALQPLTAIEARRAECQEPGRKRRGKRKPRKTCYRGTYIETATRRKLYRKTRVSCATGKPRK